MAYNGIVPAPPVEIAPFGLLSAANVVEYDNGDDPHWLKEMQVETEACYFDTDIYDVCDPSNTAAIVTADTGDRAHQVNPFAITAVDKCSTTGFVGHNRESRVLRQLDLITQKAVEKEFWGGELATAAANSNRFLAQTGSTSVGTALSARRALAALEDALASCGAGARGMIHAPRQVASLLEQHIEYETVGTGELAQQRLVTKLGTVLVAGVGYTGTAPNNQAPASNRMWMYATGPVSVFLGPSAVVGEVSAWIDEGINDLTLQAERGAAVVWDGCCHFAVEVDVTL